jgi:hypothetical protein
LWASHNMFENKPVGIVDWVCVSRRALKNCINIVAHLDSELNIT